LSKARLRRLYGADALGTERAYARRLVMRAVPRLLVRGIARRDRESLLGAGAILVSLAVTGAAYAAGRAASSRESSAPMAARSRRFSGVISSAGTTSSNSSSM
jgi:hypothetical protein